MTVAAPGEPVRPASAGMRHVHARVLRQAALMAELAGGPEAELGARAPAVSGWSVAEQLEHLMLVDRGVLKLMGHILDDPRPMPEAAINLAGRVVLLAGFIPRGRAQAPAAQGPAAPAIECSLAGTGPEPACFQ